MEAGVWAFRNYLGGQFGISFVAWACYMVNELGINLPDLQSRMDTDCSIGWWFPHKTFCVMSDRPEVIHVERNNQGINILHSNREAAIRWRDGYSFYFWHGIRIPARAIENVESYSAPEILSEKNTEVRRALMSLYGWNRILPEVNASLIDSHSNPEIGNLYEFFIGGQRYHVVECHDPGLIFGKSRQKPFNCMIGTRPSINTVVDSLKDLYPLYEDLSGENYLEIPRT